MEIKLKDFKNKNNYYNCQFNIKEAIAKTKLASFYCENGGLYDQIEEALEILESLEFVG